MVEESRLPSEQPPESAAHHGEEEIRYPDGRIERPSIRFETTDVSFPAILKLVLGAMIFAAIVNGVVLAFFYEYNRYESKVKESPFKLGRTPGEKLSQDDMPREPRLGEQLERMEAPLEQTPEQRAAAHREARKANTYLRQKDRETILYGYGPSITGEDTYVHVPWPDAMNYALEHKLFPSRTVKNVKEPHDRGLVDSGESNSGRMFRRRGLWSEH